MKTMLMMALLCAALCGQTPFTFFGPIEVHHENGTTTTEIGAVSGVERTESASGAIVSGSAGVTIAVGPCDWTGTVTASHVDPATGARTYVVTFSCGGARIRVTWTVGYPAGDACYVSYHNHSGAGHGFGTAWW